MKEDTEFERTALSFYLHECSMLEHITKFAVKTTLDFYSSFSKNNASPLCEWVDDPHGLVNCWIELRVPIVTRSCCSLSTAMMMAFT